MAYIYQNCLLILAVGCLLSAGLATLVLPGASEDPLEPITTHEGFIDAYISDNFETNREEKIILLREPAGDVHHLLFEQTPSDLHTGAFVRVHGRKFDKRTIKVPMSDRHVATKVSRFQVVRLAGPSIGPNFHHVDTPILTIPGLDSFPCDGECAFPKEALGIRNRAGGD